MTAVEWLSQQLVERPFSMDLIKAALKKEKEQIIDAATWGGLAETGEQYFKEKYKK